jgi:cytochrome b subunit of formate dehydrogenase
MKRSFDSGDFMELVGSLVVLPLLVLMVGIVMSLLYFVVYFAIKHPAFGVLLLAVAVAGLVLAALLHRKLRALYPELYKKRREVTNRS